MFLSGQEYLSEKEIKEDRINEDSTKGKELLLKKMLSPMQCKKISRIRAQDAAARITGKKM